MVIVTMIDKNNFDGPNPHDLIHKKHGQWADEKKKHDVEPIIDLSSIINLFRSHCKLRGKYQS